MNSQHRPRGHKVIVVFVALVFLLTAAFASAQTSRTGSKNRSKTLELRFGLTSRQVRALSPLIEQEIKKLQIVYAAYNEQDDEDFMLGWNESDIWLKLILNRKDIETGMKGLFTVRQADAMRRAASRMEGEMLSMLLDDQVGMLSEELDLRPEQGDQLNAAISRSNKKKQLLLSDMPVQSDSKLFLEKLALISADADANVSRLLTPEQRSDYAALKRRANANRLRFWAVIRSQGDQRHRS
jgi:hypothetical protein